MFLWSILKMFSLETSGKSSIGYYSILIMLLLEIMAFIVIFLNIKDLINSKLNIAVFAWLIWVIINNLVNSDDLFLDMREVLWWPLIYFLFYFIAFNDSNGKFIQSIIKFFPILFIVMLVQYLLIRSTNSFFYTESGKAFYGPSNSIYYNALLMPFAFLVKRKGLKYLLLVIGLVLVLFSFKRAPIIFAALIIVMAMYYDFIVSKNMSLLRGLFFSCIVLIAGFLAFNYINNKTGEFLTQRFESMKKDNGSGRLEIYQNVWEKFNHKGFEYQIIGSGHNSVSDSNKTLDDNGKLIGISAHNDYLEVIYDFGLIGLVFFLIVLSEFIKQLLYLKNVDDKLFQANFAAFIIFFVMSMVSHLFTLPTYFAYLVIVLALSAGMIRRSQENFNPQENLSNLQDHT